MTAGRFITFPLRRGLVILLCWAGAAGGFVLAQSLATTTGHEAAAPIVPRWSHEGSPDGAGHTGRSASAPVNTVEAWGRRIESGWEVVARAASPASALDAVNSARVAIEADLRSRSAVLIERRAGELRARLKQLESERSLLDQALSIASGDEAAGARARLDAASTSHRRAQSALEALSSTDPAGYSSRRVQIGAAAPRRSWRLSLASQPVVVLGAVVLALSLLAAWAVDANDTRFRSPAEVQARLRLPVLGVVPRLPLRAASAGSAPDAIGSLRSFSDLALRLEAVVAQGNLRSLAVTSAVDGEGKTTVAAGLAVALARRGMRVALVEGNLLQPALHALFQLPRRRGIADLLENASLSTTSAVDVFSALSDSQITEYAPSLPGSTLNVFCAGEVASPIAVLLDRRKLQPLFLRLSRAFDLVICDARSLLSAGDGLAVARVADGTLLVLRAGKTEGRDVAWARQVLRQGQVTATGLILNECAPGTAARWRHVELEAEKETTAETA